jgi:hypothetical protein
MAEMEDLRSGDLCIAVLPPAGAAQPVRLLWRGKSTERNPGLVLSPFFAKVLELAAKEQAAIEMIFHELEHFNSSTITAVIQFIQNARQQSAKVTVIYNPALKWQKLAFEALRVFSRGDDLLELSGRVPERT